MADPFLGEIRMFAGTYAPVDWAFCDGALISIADNSALFNLIGTLYGGDGQTTFALPDLRGRLPMHQGGGFALGQSGGLEEVTLTIGELPAHSHPLVGAGAPGAVGIPANAVLASSTGMQPFAVETPSVALATNSISTAGSSQTHTNLQPYLCVNFIIALDGIYPPKS